MRIRILFVTLMWIRIRTLSFTLMRIRILPFPLMRTRILLDTFMRIRILASQVKAQTLKKRSNRLIGIPYSLACHLRTDTTDPADHFEADPDADQHAEQTHQEQRPYSSPQKSKPKDSIVTDPDPGSDAFLSPGYGIREG
jgi:hypothetical protein